MKSQAHVAEANGKEWRKVSITVAAVLVLGLITTFATWHFVIIHEQDTVHWASRLAAQAVRADILNDLEWQKVGLDRLALLWEAADPPQQLWIRNSELYLQHRPGSVAVEWFSEHGESRAVIPARGSALSAGNLAFDGVPSTLIRAAVRSNTVMFSAPVALSNRRIQWVIARPVYVNGQFRGTIVSFFDLEQCLDHLLRTNESPDFSFAVWQGDQLIYFQPGIRPEYKQDGALIDTPLSGVGWRVHASPSPMVIKRITSGLPFFTLAIGSALSMLLALTLYFALRATSASAGIRRANQNLIQEITLRKQIEQELRQARDELNLRVQERTAALEESNTKLERAKDYLQELTGRIFRLQDEERRRLARELHDGTTQNLIALAMNFARLRKSLPSSHAADATLFSDSIQLIDRSIQELRTMSHLLHPPLIEELGLPDTLRSYVDGFVARSGIRVSLEIEPSLPRMDNDAELGIFRIVQEALANIHRHSEGGAAKIVLLRSEEFLRLEVADDGKGISPDTLMKINNGAAGVGMAGMRERVRLLGGCFDVNSNNHGTTIRVLLPVVERGLLASTPVPAQCNS